MSPREHLEAPYIWRKSNGRFKARPKTRDNKRPQATFNTLKEAIEYVRRVMGNRAPDYSEYIEKPKEVVYLRDLKEQVMKDHLETKPNRKTDPQKYQTWNAVHSHTRLLFDRVTQAIGDEVMCRDLTIDHYTELKKLLERKNLAEATITYHFGNLNCRLREHGFTPPKMKLKTHRKKKPLRITLKDVLSVVDELEKTWHKAVLMLCVNTGMRRNDILYYKWEQITEEWFPNLTTGESELLPCLTVVSHKTGLKEGTKIPLLKKTSEVLKELEKEVGEATGYIFKARNSSLYGVSTMPQNPINRAIKKANVPHFTPHRIRALMVSVVASITGNLKFAMEMFGWKNEEVVKNHYLHSDPSLVASVFTKLNNDPEKSEGAAKQVDRLTVFKNLTMELQAELGETATRSLFEKALSNGTPLDGTPQTGTP